MVKIVKAARSAICAVLALASIAACSSGGSDDTAILKAINGKFAANPVCPLVIIPFRSNLEPKKTAELKRAGLITVTTTALPTEDDIVPSQLLRSIAKQNDPNNMAYWTLCYGTIVADGINSKTSDPSVSKSDADQAYVVTVKTQFAWNPKISESVKSIAPDFALDLSRMTPQMTVRVVENRGAWEMTGCDSSGSLVACR